MPDGFPMEIFAGIPWSQYLNGMWRDGNYDEEITLHAIPNIFGNEIFVVWILGQQGIVYILSHSCILYWRTVFFYLVLEAKFKPMEEQSDPLGDKIDLISDEINSRENGINRPGNDFSLGKKWKSIWKRYQFRRKWNQLIWKRYQFRRKWNQLIQKW